MLLTRCPSREQGGCQTVYFYTKNPNLGIFRRALEWKMFVHFMTTWNILLPFGIIYGCLWSYGNFSPVLVCLTKTNLATLVERMHLTSLSLLLLKESLGSADDQGDRIGRIFADWAIVYFLYIKNTSSLNV
jgi:hypothetical protein